MADDRVIPSHETPSYNFEGDPEFQERHFVDTTGYVPPWMQEDAFTKAARTRADETVDEVLDPDYVSAISIPGQEPGASEFSWGRGNLNSPTLGPGISALDHDKAIMRTNPADPTDTAEAHYNDVGWGREP